MKLCYLLAVLHTLLADVDELHGQLQLPPLGPVGRVHGHQQGVEQSLDILRVLNLVFRHTSSCVLHCCSLVWFPLLTVLYEY